MADCGSRTLESHVTCTNLIGLKYPIHCTTCSWGNSMSSSSKRHSLHFVLHGIWLCFSNHFLQRSSWHFNPFGCCFYVAQCGFNGLTSLTGKISSYGRRFGRDLGGWFVALSKLRLVRLLGILRGFWSVLQLNALNAATSRDLPNDGDSWADWSSNASCKHLKFEEVETFEDILMILMLMLNCRIHVILWSFGTVSFALRHEI